MPKSGLTGSRIRTARIAKGLRQAELAANVGISPAYLNLIEHNKRRIGGKLLINISGHLGVETGLLSKGARTGVLEAMEKAAANSEGTAHVEPSEEMAGRFPGWADVVALQHNRIETLERTVETLSDRLAHDPQLATTMHEILSVVTAIRSTASILAEDGSLEAEWLHRFHRNMLEDSKRLAESSQSLVAHLDATDDGRKPAEPTLPKEELEQWLAARDFHVTELEPPSDTDVTNLVGDQKALSASATTAAFSVNYFERYQSDALAIPVLELSNALADPGFDPLVFAQNTGCDFATVLRRIASLPPRDDSPVGLVVCDGSGTLTFSKPVDGFALPRFGAACPQWPLYQALSRPNIPIRTIVEHSAHQQMRFLTYSIALPISAPDFSAPPIYEATMLILPDVEGSTAPMPIGTSCRICPRIHCRGRREPSILTSGF